MIVRNPVASDDRASPVCAMQTMDEHRTCGGAVEDGVQLGNLFNSWGRQSVQWYVYLPHPQAFDQPLFDGRAPSTLAEVDDGLDAKLGEVLKTRVRGLGPAGQAIIHLMKVWQARSFGSCEDWGRHQADRQRGNGQNADAL